VAATGTLRELADQLLDGLDGILHYCRTKVPMEVVEAANGNINPFSAVAADRRTCITSCQTPRAWQPPRPNWWPSRKRAKMQVLSNSRGEPILEPVEMPRIRMALIWGARTDRDEVFPRPDLLMMGFAWPSAAILVEGFHPGDDALPKRRDGTIILSRDLAGLRLIVLHVGRGRR